MVELDEFNATIPQPEGKFLELPFRCYYTGLKAAQDNLGLWGQWICWVPTGVKSKRHFYAATPYTLGEYRPGDMFPLPLSLVIHWDSLKTQPDEIRKHIEETRLALCGFCHERGFQVT